MNNLVFIVEDNPVDQTILRMHFVEVLGNYTVQTFSKPEDMFAHLKEKPFAVVLDHFFADKNGKTGLYYLKVLKKKYSSIPIIYYTTLDDKTVRADAMALGAEQYIIKNSASLVRLRTTLDLLHEKRARRKGLFQKLFKRH